MFNSRLIISIITANIFFACSYSQPNPINDKWINFTESNSGLLDDYIRCIEVDATNNLWIAAGNTYGGFVLKRTDGRLTMYDGTWNYFENPYLDHSKYFYENLFISKNGDKWMGKNGGNLEHASSFYRFSSQNEWKAFEVDDNTFDMVYFTGINDSTVLIEHSAGIGTILAGYDTFQLVYGVTYKDNPGLLDYENFHSQQKRKTIIRSGKYPTTAIKAIDDTTLIGFSFKGVSWYHYGAGKLQYLKDHKLPLDGKSDNSDGGEYANNIWLDQDHSIWVGYANGLFKLQDDTFESFFAPDSLKWHSILDLKFDVNNTAWFITDHSLISFDKKKWNEIFINDKADMDWFTCLEIDRKGNIWIGTRYQGIFVYNPEGLKLLGSE